MSANDRDRIDLARIGLAIRERRMAIGHRQVDLSDACGVSTTRISRMEIGVSSGIPIGAWLRVCAALGLELSVQGVLDPSDQQRQSAFTLIIRQAESGGWEWVRAGDDLVLLRPIRREVLVARVWTTVGDVAGMTEALTRRVGLEVVGRPDGWRAGGLVIVVQSGPTRRRLTEHRAAMLAWTGGPGSLWRSALRKPSVPMPAGHGLLWADPAITRLRPTLPLLDHRVRTRRRRTGG